MRVKSLTGNTAGPSSLLDGAGLPMGSRYAQPLGLPEIVVSITFRSFSGYEASIDNPFQTRYGLAGAKAGIESMLESEQKDLDIIRTHVEKRQTIMKEILHRHDVARARVDAIHEAQLQEGWRTE